MAEGSNAAPIDIEAEDEYIELTRTRRTIKKRDAFKFLCERYAAIFNKMADDTVPETELCAKLREFAIVVQSGQARVTRRYILDRNRKIWFKLLLKAVSELTKQFEKLEQMHDSLDREEEQTKFESALLTPAIVRCNRAQRLAKACKNVIDDLKEHLGGDYRYMRKGQRSRSGQN